MPPADALNMKKGIHLWPHNGFTNERLKYTYLPKTISAEIEILLCSKVGGVFLTFAVYHCQQLCA